MTEMQSILLDLVSRICTTDSGWCTSEFALLVGRQPGHDSDRKHSALILRELKALEASGYVCRLDGQAPRVWCKAA
jgi:hypothetical protein